MRACEAIVLCLLLAGCATRPTPNTTAYDWQARDWDTWAIVDRPVTENDSIVIEVPAFTLVVMPLDELNKLFHVRYPEIENDVWGFAEPWDRTIFTHWAKWRWDKDGFPLPDMETMGHELWHLPELGHHWHE